MKKETKGEPAVRGMSPEEWERRLEESAHDPSALADTLAALDEGIHREHTFLHEEPEPDSLLSMVLDFHGVPEDDDYEGPGRRIEKELAAERWLKKRYRTWIPGETVLDHIFPYVKNFGAEIGEDGSGLQFPERDPANYHLLFDSRPGRLVIRRVYRRDLPRIGGTASPSRAVLLEMARDIVPSLEEVRALVVDNAANHGTRGPSSPTAAKRERASSR